MRVLKSAVALGFALSAGASLVPGLASAQSAERDTLAAYPLEGVTVTATRSPVDLDRIPRKIDVITSDDLSRTAASSVADALRSTTPIDVIQYPGLLTGISIRGFRPRISGTNPYTLVLIDGRPAGTTNLSLLQLGGVERIEVVRGPVSSLYGSNAMGGVVNVVTRHSTGPIGGSVTLGYGSFGDYEASLSAGGGAPGGLDFDLMLRRSGQRSGYSTGSNRTFGSDSLVKTLPDGSSVRLPWVGADASIDFAEYGATSGRGRLGYAFSPRWRADVTASGFLGDGVQSPSDLNVAWDGRSLKDVLRRSFDVSLSGQTPRATPELRVFSTLEKVSYYNAPESPHFINYRTPIRTYGLQAQDVLHFGPHDLTVGADYTATEAKSEAFSADDVPSAPYGPDSAIRSAAAFAQGRLSLLDDRLSLVAGGRVDRVAFHVLDTPHLTGFPANSERHLVVTPDAGARWSVGGGVQVHGTVGRAFVAPDAFNVAGYSEQRAGQDRGAVFVTRGNPDLRPETSWSWDAGLTLRRPERGLDADVTFFHTDVGDRITTRTEPSSGIALTARGDTILSTTSYVNVDEAAIRGIEVRASYELGALFDGAEGLRLFLSGTRILEAEERYVETDRTQPILNVADLTVVGGLDFDAGSRVTGRLSARYVGERIDSDYVDWSVPGEIRYPAYLVADLTGTVRVATRYQVGVALINLGDEDYFEVRGFDLPGRSLRVSVSAEY